ncbi:MAG: 50S ribosomal protein L10 [Bacteroidetes bacterium]|jgi:large subunit ribosomal protein L10|nr:50S ribosomal protein L10 [Bacteroidota bacterium]
MTRQEKAIAIEELKNKFETAEFFYLTDASAMSVAEVTDLRGRLYEKGVEMKVVKNKLAIKALEEFESDRNFESVYPFFKGPTALLFTDTANIPAKVIREFREDHERPILKAAYIQADLYEGDEQIKPLSELKSKEDLIGEIVVLLQSPAKNVISALSSGGQTLAGLVKAIQEKKGAEA